MIILPYTRLLASTLLHLFVFVCRRTRVYRDTHCLFNTYIHVSRYPVLTLKVLLPYLIQFGISKVAPGAVPGGRRDSWSNQDFGRLRIHVQPEQIPLPPLQSVLCIGPVLLLLEPIPGEDRLLLDAANAPPVDITKTTPRSVRHIILQHSPSSRPIITPAAQQSPPPSSLYLILVWISYYCDIRPRVVFQHHSSYYYYFHPSTATQVPSSKPSGPYRVTSGPSLLLLPSDPPPL